MGLGFNRWKQHTRNCVSRRSVAGEAKTTDLLHGMPESAHVGTLAERRFSPADCPAVRSKPLIGARHSSADRWDTSRATTPLEFSVDISRTRGNIASGSRRSLDPVDCITTRACAIHHQPRNPAATVARNAIGRVKLIRRRGTGRSGPRRVSWLRIEAWPASWQISSSRSGRRSRLLDGSSVLTRTTRPTKCHTRPFIVVSSSRLVVP